METEKFGETSKKTDEQISLVLQKEISVNPEEVIKKIDIILRQKNPNSSLFISLVETKIQALLALGELEKLEEVLVDLEDKAFLGDKQIIDIYTSIIINIFLINFKDLNEEQKSDFLQEKLENLEEVVFQFIDDIGINEEGKRERFIYSGNKNLYKKVGDFYSEIGFFSEALDAYKSLSETDYKSFLYIAELYEKFKFKIEAHNIENIDKLIIDNYNTALKIADLNNDLETQINTLEKLGDFYKKQNNPDYTKYYLEIIPKIYDKTIYLKTFARLFEKLDFESISIMAENQQVINISLEMIYSRIIQEVDKSYLLKIASLYEINDNVELAFQAYLIAFQDSIKDSKDAFLMFLETSLSDFIRNQERDFIEKIKITNDDDFSDSVKELQIISFSDETKDKQELLKRIISYIEEENKVIDEHIETLFEFSLKHDFYENYDIKTLNLFLQAYNYKNINFNLYFYVLMQNIFSFNGVDLEHEDIKQILGKIKSFETLTQKDIDLILLLINDGEM